MILKKLSGFFSAKFDSRVHGRRHGRPRSVSPDLRRNRNVDRRVADLGQAERLPAVVDRQHRRRVATSQPRLFGDPDPVEVEIGRVFVDLRERRHERHQVGGRVRSLRAMLRRRNRK